MLDARDVQGKLANIRQDLVNLLGPQAFNVASELLWYKCQQQVRRVASHVEQGRVLDIGCGLGHTSAMLKTIRPDLEVTGLDRIFDLDNRIAWEWLAPTPVRFIQGDALALPFEDASFDCAMSFGVMGHVADELLFLRENFRILRRGGIVAMFDLPNRYGINVFLWESTIAKTPLGKRLNLGYHERRYRERDSNPYGSIRIQRVRVVL